MSNSGNDGYEKKDVNVTKVIGYTVFIVVIFVAILIFLSEYFLYTTEKMVYETVLKPESISYRDLRAREDEILTNYKVLDKEKGIYQIPIEQAMKITADEAYEEQKK